MTTQIKIGSIVRRKSDMPFLDRRPPDVGTVIELDLPLGRARVKWPSNRTWFKISGLDLIFSN